MTTTPTLTDRQREMMRHALGLDLPKSMRRNLYACGDDTREDEWLDLVSKGFAVRNGMYGGATIFSVTDAGRAALKESDT